MNARERDAHPHLLPWYAAGRLDAAEARKVEEHLERCEECAAVAGPIASISRSLSAAAKEHVEVEELANWEAGRIRGEPARSARIEAHLAGCVACRDDLTALRGTKKLASMRKLPVGWWLAAAAAAIVVGVALPIVGSRWWTPEVVLLPPIRTENPVPSIDGSRSLAVRCVLPGSATSREYAIRLERDDGSLLRRMDGLYTLDGDAHRVSLVLDPISQAGLYRIVLEPIGGPPQTTYVYRFRVQP